MQKQKIRVAIVGCGNIAGTYAKQIKSYPHVEILGFHDLAADRAKARAEEFGGKVYGGLDEVLEDPAVDLVVSLTQADSHAAVVRACIEAGKAVHTEKPFALGYNEARELVELAGREQVRLSSAPITYMGEAQETAWRQLRAGKVGTPRLAYAEINHGRIEAWHPNPEPFYNVGVLWDVGVYPLTILSAFFGPVRRVTGIKKMLCADRVTKENRPFTITNPDFALALLEFGNGVVARLTANFYTRSRQGGEIEIHGDLGRIWIEDFQNFGAKVESAAYGEESKEVPLIRPRGRGIEFGRGVDEMATAMLAGRPQRATGAHAAHVIEILEAIETSAAEGRPVEVRSEFVSPLPIDIRALHPFTE